VERPLTENKRTVEAYMAGFRATDHATILSCLTDDVEWVIPGMFHLKGRRLSIGKLGTKPSWASQRSR